MTTSPFGTPNPFESPKGQPAEPVAETPAPAEGTSSKRTPLLIGLVGVAAAAAVGTGLFFFTQSGSDVDDTVASPPGGGTTQAAPESTPTDTSTPLPTLTQFNGRNPFAAQVVEGGAGAAPASTPVATSAPVSTGSSAFNGGGSSSGTRGGSPSGSNAGASAASVAALQAQIAALQDDITALEKGGTSGSDAEAIAELQAQIDALAVALADAVAEAAKGPQFLELTVRNPQVGDPGPTDDRADFSWATRDASDASETTGLLAGELVSDDESSLANNVEFLRLNVDSTGAAVSAEVLLGGKQFTLPFAQPVTVYRAP